MKDFPQISAPKFNIPSVVTEPNKIARLDYFLVLVFAST
jgi:hypothetical protein